LNKTYEPVEIGCNYYRVWCKEGTRISAYSFRHSWWHSYSQNIQVKDIWY